MNPFKNISVFRDQDIYSGCSLRPWSDPDLDAVTIDTTEFPEKQEWDMDYNRYKELSDKLKGNTDYAKSQLMEVNLLTKKMEQVQQENDRLQHLTNLLIQHLSKSGNNAFPLKDIDKQMALYDDGGIDGTPRNA
jgi:hypothetical protein